MFGLKAEPAVILTVTAAVVQAALLYLTDNPVARYGWIVPVLSILAGILTRARVTSEATLNQAGLTPEKVVEMAADPTIPPVVELPAKET